MKKYTIIQLMDIFENHAKIAEEIKNKDIEIFKTKFPGEKLPSHLLSDFNIPNALYSICEAICDRVKYDED